MKITNIKKIIVNNTCRLSADLVFENQKVHNVYFEVEKKYSEFVNDTADSFFAVALVIAMRKRETLIIDCSVSKKLVSHNRKIQSILASWNMNLSPVKIYSSNKTLSAKSDQSVGAFFSAGVDSFYTYFKNKEKITHLIFVHGFDISLSKQQLFETVKKNIKRVANAEGIPVVYVRTNVREVFENYFDWDMSHEFAIASVTLFLGKGFKEIFASCGLPNKNTDHHYMTPELDILWRTESMSLHHYGCLANKEAKLKFLSKSTTARNNLRVCWVNKFDKFNCSTCEKCFRNMLGLYLAGSHHKFKTFSPTIDTEKLKALKVNKYVVKYFTAILESFVKRNDTSEVRYALEEMVSQNMKEDLIRNIYSGLREYVRLFDKKYNKNRIYWFLAQRGVI